MIRLAFQLASRVQAFWERVRAFYYEVMLSEHRCPTCNGRLVMTKESRCRCEACGRELDPTVAFQQCASCGGRPALNIRRYACSECGADLASRFVFEGLVFDAEYFREKMAEHRERKREQRERVRQMLAASRSESILTPQIEGLTPDLLLALDGLMAGPEPSWMPELGSRFDLRRYESHVKAHIGPIAISLEQVPPLSETPRLDRIWRFIAIIFLAHAGILEIRQDGPTIMVRQRETDTEGQGVPGEAQGADEQEGPVGRVEA